MFENNPPNAPKIGLALGGGGARGLAHIGVLKVIERAGIQIDLIAGTSMGGLIGAMAAANLPLAEIEASIIELASTKQMSRLIDFSLSKRGLLKGMRIYDLLADTLGADLTFADLDRTLAVVATDTRSNREIVLDEGRVIDAVRATISVPGFFVPVEYQNMSLVDGGMVNNVPVDVVLGMGADLVIAVDVMPNFSRNVPGKMPEEVMLDLPVIPGVLHEAFNMVYFMMSVITDLKLAVNPPHVLIRPSLPADIGVLIGFDRAREIIDLGEKAAVNAYEELTALTREIK
jgi:NTE family protein